MNNKLKAFIAIILGSLIVGAISPVTKIAILKIPPFSFTFIRFLLSSMCLLPLFLKSKPKIEKGLIVLILLSLLPSLNIALFVVGLKLTTASIAQFLYAGTPLLSGIFSYLLFKDKISFKKWFFITLGLVGVFMVIFLPLLEKSNFFVGNLKGNLLIIVGVTLWSLYFVYSKKLQKKYSPISITSVFIFVATILFFFLSIWEFRGSNMWLREIKVPFVLAVVYVSLFGTVGNYLLNQYAIKFAGPLLASLAFYLSPIFAYFFSFLLLGEKLTIGLIIGTVLVFASVALTTYSK